MGFLRPRFGHDKPMAERMVICDECLALVLKEESYGHDMWHLAQRERNIEFIGRLNELENGSDKKNYQDDEKNGPQTDVHI